MEKKLRDHVAGAIDFKSMGMPVHDFYIINSDNQLLGSSWDNDEEFFICDIDSSMMSRMKEMAGPVPELPNPFAGEDQKPIAQVTEKTACGCCHVPTEKGHLIKDGENMICSSCFEGIYCE